MEHDKTYKLLFSHAEMVEDLLRGFVPEEWVSQLDLATLEKYPGSYVSDNLDRREDDVVWRLRCGEGWAYGVRLKVMRALQHPGYAACFSMPRQ